MRFFLASVFIFLLLHPSPLWGAGKGFRPNIVGYFGKFETEVYHRKNEMETEERRTRHTRTSLRELFDFGLYGYSYHPNFVVFFLKISAGLQEERIQSGHFSSPWRIGSAESFDFRATVLPRHPYNLEVFSKKTAPLLAGSSIYGGRVEHFESGALLSYRRQPWDGNLSYSHNEVQSDQLTTQTDLYRAALSYSRNSFVLTNGYSHTASHISDGEEITRDQYYLENRLRFGSFKLDSRYRVEEEEKEKEQTAYKEETWRRRWEERLHGELPWNFHTSLSYFQHKEINTVSSGALDTPIERTLDSMSYAFLLRHRLYQSLNSAFTATRTETDASGGDTAQRNYRLDLNYRKLIYGHNTLNTRFFRGRNTSEQTGAPLIFRESQSASPLGIILLNNQLVNIESIQVEVVDFIDPNITAELTRDDFIVDDFGAFVRLTIVRLPAPFLIGDVDQYGFLLTFAQERAAFELQTDSWGASFQLALFENRVFPYYQYTALRQTIGEGSLPNPPDQVDIHAAGATYRGYPFEAGMDYQRTDSLLFPEKRWNYRAKYIRKLGDYTESVIQVQRESTDLLGGEGRPLNFEERTEHLTTASFTLSSRNPGLGLSGNLGASYSHFDGLADTDRYLLRSVLRWQKGKSEIELQGSLSWAESIMSNNESAERNDRNLYLRFSRKLF
jgi:hypothetical protein